MDKYSKENLELRAAKKRVRDLKGFYTHLLVDIPGKVDRLYRIQSGHLFRLKLDNRDDGFMLVNLLKKIKYFSSSCVMNLRRDRNAPLCELPDRGVHRIKFDPE